MRRGELLSDLYTCFQGMSSRILVLKRATQQECSGVAPRGQGVHDVLGMHWGGVVWGVAVAGVQGAHVPWAQFLLAPALQEFPGFMIVLAPDFFLRISLRRTSSKLAFRVH
uniref:Uncharacterized protein n=1 Tax=Sphaerodactylus townsendi TaxID=933632 RepID=A0ACB8F7R7_9SAUR